MLVNISPLMAAALHSIVTDYILENKTDPFGKPLQWVNVATDDTITIDDVLTFISAIE